MDGSVEHQLADVSFKAIPCDDRDLAGAHFHARTETGEIVLDVYSNGGIILSAAHGDPIRGEVTAPELHAVLNTARLWHAELLLLWTKCWVRGDTV
jgi:hypothetical protein